MSFMLWRKLINRLQRPKDRRKGRHCAENLAIANREYLKKAAENGALGGGGPVFSDLFPPPPPTREHRCFKDLEPDMDRPRHFTCPTWFKGTYALR